MNDGVTWRRRHDITSWLVRHFELQDPAQARLLPMEGLRGLAVGLVFVQHVCVQVVLLAAPAAVPAAVVALRHYGNAGVDLFFVLSGLLIYGHLVQRRPRLVAFLRRRAVRLYPAFLCAFALALALKAAPSGRLPGAVELAANLLFVPGMVPIPAVLTVAWSLSYEVFFYLAAFALVSGLGLDRWRRRARVGLLAGLAATFAALAVSSGPAFPGRLAPFFAGMLLAEGVGGGVPSWLGLAAPAAAFAAIVTWPYMGLTEEGLHTVAFFLLCAACFRPGSCAGRAFAWPALRWLGNMSYSYYLVHGFVVLLWARALAAAFGTGLPVAWVLASVPALFAVTLAAGAALFLLVEKPLSLRPGRSRADQSPTAARSASRCAADVAAQEKRSA